LGLNPEDHGSSGHLNMVKDLVMLLFFYFLFFIICSYILIFLSLSFILSFIILIDSVVHTTHYFILVAVTVLQCYFKNYRSFYSYHTVEVGRSHRNGILRIVNIDRAGNLFSSTTVDRSFNRGYSSMYRLRATYSYPQILSNHRVFIRSFCESLAVSGDAAADGTENGIANLVKSRSEAEVKELELNLYKSEQQIKDIEAKMLSQQTDEAEATKKSAEDAQRLADTEALKSSSNGGIISIFEGMFKCILTEEVASNVNDFNMMWTTFVKNTSTFVWLNDEYKWLKDTNSISIIENVLKDLDTFVFFWYSEMTNIMVLFKFYFSSCVPVSFNLRADLGNAIANLKHVKQSYIYNLLSTCPKSIANIFYGIASGANNMVYFIPTETQKFELTIVRSQKDNVYKTDIRTPSYDGSGTKTYKFIHTNDLVQDSNMDNIQGSGLSGTPFRNQSWFSIVQKLYDIELSIDYTLGSVGEAVQKSLIVRGSKNSAPTMEQGWETLSTVPLDPKVILNSKYLVELLLSIFMLVDKINISDDKKTKEQILSDQLELNVQLTWFASIYLKYLKRYLSTNRDVEFIDVTVNIVIERKINTLDGLHNNFHELVMSGNFICSTQLHYAFLWEKYTLEAWREITFWSAFCVYGLDPGMVGIAPYLPSESKNFIHDILCSSTFDMLSTSYYKSKQIHPALNRDPQRISRELFILELWFRAICRDQYIPFPWFSSGGWVFGKNQSPIILRPNLNVNLCVYELADFRSKLEHLFSDLVFEGLIKRPVYARGVTRLLENVPVSLFETFVDSKALDCEIWVEEEQYKSFPISPKLAAVTKNKASGHIISSNNALLVTKLSQQKRSYSSLSHNRRSLVVAKSLSIPNDILESGDKITLRVIVDVHNSAGINRGINNRGFLETDDTDGVSLRNVTVLKVNNYQAGRKFTLNFNIHSVGFSTLSGAGRSGSKTVSDPIISEYLNLKLDMGKGYNLEQHKVETIRKHFETNSTKQMDLSAVIPNIIPPTIIQDDRIQDNLSIKVWNTIFKGKYSIESLVEVKEKAKLFIDDMNKISQDGSKLSHKQMHMYIQAQGSSSFLGRQHIFKSEMGYNGFVDTMNSHYNKVPIEREWLVYNIKDEIIRWFQLNPNEGIITPSRLVEEAKTTSGGMKGYDDYRDFVFQNSIEDLLDILDNKKGALLCDYIVSIVYNRRGKSRAIFMLDSIGRMMESFISGGTYDLFNKRKGLYKDFTCEGMNDDEMWYVMRYMKSDYNYVRVSLDFKAYDTQFNGNDYVKAVFPCVQHRMNEKHFRRIWCHFMRWFNQPKGLIINPKDPKRVLNYFNSLASGLKGTHSVENIWGVSIRKKLIDSGIRIRKWKSNGDDTYYEVHREDELKAQQIIEKYFNVSWDKSIIGHEATTWTRKWFTSTIFPIAEIGTWRSIYETIDSSKTVIVKSKFYLTYGKLIQLTIVLINIGISKDEIEKLLQDIVKYSEIKIDIFRLPKSLEVFTYEGKVRPRKNRKSNGIESVKTELNNKYLPKLLAGSQNLYNILYNAWNSDRWINLNPKSIEWYPFNYKLELKSGYNYSQKEGEFPWFLRDLEYKSFELTEDALVRSLLQSSSSPCIATGKSYYVTDLFTLSMAINERNSDVWKNM
jgi:hypothetical protein